jgi:Skp family chaperone for outer membrane proteins
MRLCRKFGKFNGENMKRLVAFLCVVGAGIIYLSALAPKVDDKTKKESVSAVSASLPSLPSSNVAVVSSSRISSEYYKLKEGKDNWTKAIDAAQKELLAMASEFEKTRKEYQDLLDKATNPALTEAAGKKAKTEAEDIMEILKQKELAIRDFKANSESRIAKMISDENTKISLLIKQKTGEIAQAKGVTLVFDGDAPTIFFAAVELDITADVIAALNADQPKVVQPKLIPAAASAAASAKK